MHLDSDTDLWDSYNGLPYAHGTMFKRAIEEGVPEPARMIQLGLRGPLYGEDDEAIPGHARRRDRRLAGARRAGRPPPCWSGCGRGSATARRSCTFDIDFVDPAFAPGTGTPEVGGPTSHEALAARTARSRRSPFVGYDVVEVAPEYDGPGQITALFAANAIFEMLSLVSLGRAAAAGNGRLP